MIRHNLKLVMRCTFLFLKSILSGIKVIISSRFNPKIKHLNANPNQTCYILGNGPSLKSVLENSSNVFKDSYLFVVNEFVSSPYYSVLKPQVYVLTDPSYWMKAISKEYKEIGETTLASISLKTTWPMFLAIPKEAYKNRDIHKLFEHNANVTLVDYNLTKVSGLESTNHLFYATYLGTPRVQNVLVACLLFAINIGFHEVNLLGAEHSWTQFLAVNDNNQVCITDNHFYDSGEIELKPLNRLNGDNYRMHQILNDYAAMFEGYHVIKKYAQTKNVTIYNRTKNSFIDAFDKKALL